MQSERPINTNRCSVSLGQWRPTGEITRFYVHVWKVSKAAVWCRNTWSKSLLSDFMTPEMLLFPVVKSVVLDTSSEVQQISWNQRLQSDLLLLIVCILVSGLQNCFTRCLCSFWRTRSCERVSLEWDPIFVISDFYHVRKIASASGRCRASQSCTFGYVGQLQLLLYWYVY